MTYPGGKNGAGVYQRIICQIPPHQLYLEPFVGGGAVLRHKRPAPRGSIVADRDAAALHALGEGLHGRIPDLRLVHGCGLDLLRRWPWRGAEFVYCDPPYLMSVRSSPNAYYGQCEFASEAEHRELLALLRTLTVPVMVSGYWSELYGELLHDWRTVTYQATTHATHRGKGTATEWLWMNYPQPAELHDYRYLGRDYRERERITRKKKRWTEKLRKMPALERYAILAALEDVSSSLAAGAGVDHPAGKDER